MRIGVATHGVVRKPNIDWAITAASFPWRFGHAGRETSREGGLGRRRAHRVDLLAPVFLYGSMKGEPFSEHSETIDVCANGALVAVNARVFPEQRILLTNLKRSKT